MCGTYEAAVAAQRHGRVTPCLTIVPLHKSHRYALEPQHRWKQASITHPTAGLASSVSEAGYLPGLCAKHNITGMIMAHHKTTYTCTYDRTIYGAVCDATAATHFIRIIHRDIRLRTATGTASVPCFTEPTGRIIATIPLRSPKQSFPPCYNADDRSYIKSSSCCIHASRRRLCRRHVNVRTKIALAMIPG